jgi:uncharacterized protein YndB with AHSA1/START domain
MQWLRNRSVTVGPMSSQHCEVRLTRRYDAAPAEVWGALTDHDSLGRWLAGVVELELAVGGAIVLALPGDGGLIEAQVREVETERVLELHWSRIGEERSVVRFELERDGDGTLLVLDHRRIDEPVGMAYIARWSRALARLDRELGA